MLIFVGVPNDCSTLLTSLTHQLFQPSSTSRQTYKKPADLID